MRNRQNEDRNIRGMGEHGGGGRDGGWDRDRDRGRGDDPRRMGASDEIRNRGEDASRFGGYGGSYGRDHGDFDRAEERSFSGMRHGHGHEREVGNEANSERGYGYAYGGGDQPRGFRGQPSGFERAQTRDFGGRGYGDQGQGWGERRERTEFRDFDRDMDREPPMIGREGGHGATSFRGYGGSFGMGGYGGYGGFQGGETGRGASGQNMGGMRGEYGSMGRGQEQNRGPHYGKGPKGYKRSDDRIRDEVCEMIARQGEIDATDVEIRVEQGTVVLSGTVAERREKRDLEMMVEHLHGVDDVRNEIRVRRPQQMQGQGQGQGIGSQGVVQGNVQGASQNAPPQSQLPGQNGRNARS
jgi:hypothetical protein